MPQAGLHATGLIETLAIGLSAALLFGFAARSLRIPPIVGYMLAGIAVGPHTPGFVADAALATQLAEIGVALLMFGVGLHFSLDQLRAVRRIAVPGALAQSAVATLLGLLVGVVAGWGWRGGLVFGIALSVASTVVLVRGLAEQGELRSLHGQVAVGWLIVEDLFTVLVLVVLPAMSHEAPDVAAALGAMALKLAALAVTYVAAARIVPWFLERVARLHSRELFTLAVLAIALGIAFGASAAFGVSMALGAFLGGLLVGRSDLSHQAAADALPLRDAFAVLFFVSVGMLFDPAFLLAEPWLVLATVAVVVAGKPLAALLFCLGIRYPIRTGLTVGAGLAQIGEFSFILGDLGRSLGLLPAQATQAIVATALLTIAINPLLFRAVAPLERRLRDSRRLARWLASPERVGPPPPAESLHDHVVLCGHGRVGRVLSRVVRDCGERLVVIEQDRDAVQRLRRDGVHALHGDAANPFLLEQARIDAARLLLVTLPDPLANRQILRLARERNPALAAVVRIHQPAERELLERDAQVSTVLSEQELALGMARQLLEKLGISALEAQAITLDYRRGDGRDLSARTARVVEARVTAGSPAAGCSLNDLALGKGALVMTVLRDRDLLVPDGRTRLEPGDTVLIVTDRDSLPRITQAFRSG
jgi:CPA2 family monovalent cation:H+ antiporter-2